MRTSFVPNRAQAASLFAGAVVWVVASVHTATLVGAQQAGLNVQRDCQTVRTCNFARTGAVRGCLSSFSCRACKPVAVKCDLPGTNGVCQRLRCDWGG